MALIPVVDTGANTDQLIYKRLVVADVINECKPEINAARETLGIVELSRKGILDVSSLLGSRINW